ncbi:MAG: cupin domain-containing protein [Alphaproteobacteria bacterium]|jgi:anti-sigma factor ChrR (cupin superfamily)|nr:cupin domain-containing protein [Rhodospirillaceae bacterium]MBT6204483.1 cupin domain-containing protein [Rhodospirillaceae bacterium]MBT7645719.1 cupin domain-containing protein [Rhodospirillaceae bacterium]MDG2481030.1 cupin domain-containing protein [Alphaproteobacteria bacterium]
MTQEWNLDGRQIVNWKTCDWQPYPALDGGDSNLEWHPIRAEAGPGNGYYLLKVAPGGGAKLHEHTGQEEFIMLAGELVDGDGTVLKEGDCVSYDPGTRHRTTSPKGCTLLAYIAAPINTVEGDDELDTMKAGRKVVNWHDAGFARYPSLPETADPIDWHPIRANEETGEGFYIVKFHPGSSSALHEHTGVEEFIMLDGTLTDPDGTTYGTGDCISLPAGSVHGSFSEKGCVTVAMISGPLRTLV